MNNRYDCRPENIFHLNNEVVLFTGVAGQLGSSIVNELIDYDARVIAVDINTESLNKSLNDGNGMKQMLYWRRAALRNGTI